MVAFRSPVWTRVSINRSFLLDQNVPLLKGREFLRRRQPAQSFQRSPELTAKFTPTPPQHSRYNAGKLKESLVRIQSEWMPDL
jgi:hypothetical protein